MEIYARVLRCTERGGLSPAAGRSPGYFLDLPLSPRHALEAPATTVFQSVQVTLELGHKAAVREKKTTEGFTHDWAVFVRGPEGSNIQHFVEKVVFQLHESFPKPRRVIKEPPYRVSESGYAGFTFPIDIYFKNKEEPRKITFSYDLFLHTEGSPPVNHIRCEKLTFQNPTEEFRRKLIKAGGIGVPGPNDHAQYKPPTLASVPATAEGKAFTDLFGAPLLKPEAHKKQKRSKDKTGKSKGAGSPGDASSPSSVASSQGVTSPSHSKEKSSLHRPTTTVSSSSRTKLTTGVGVIPSKEKATLKRPTESSPSSSEGGKKKRTTDIELNSKHKEKKHKSHKKSHSSSRKSEKRKEEKPAESKAPSQAKVSKTTNAVPTKNTVVELSDGEISDSDENAEVEVNDVGSPISLLGLSSKSNGGPLNTLWAEIEDDEEMLSPLPKTSPAHIPVFSESPYSKSQANGAIDNHHNDKTDSTSQEAPNGETFAMLLDLQRRLISVTDTDLLHKIVRIVQDTQLYQVSDSTFDFDLCSLDHSTVKKLQEFLDRQL